MSLVATARPLREKSSAAPAAQGSGEISMADSAETVKKTVETATANVKASAQTATAQAEKIQAAGAKAFREVADKSAAGFAGLRQEELGRRRRRRPVADRRPFDPGTARAADLVGQVGDRSLSG
jgi:L-lactate utilization protein LutC